MNTHKKNRFGLTCQQVNTFHSLVDNESRIKFLYAVLGKPKIVLEQKDPKLALKYLTGGALCFRHGRCKLALRKCNKALKQCPQTDVNWKKVFSSIIELRIHILCKQNKFKAAQQDFEYLKTYNTLLSPIELKQLQSMIGSGHADITDDENQLEELTWKSGNVEYPALTKKVTLHSNQLEGRHLVAQEDIGVDEIVGVERAYVGVVSSPIHCDYCAVRPSVNYVCINCPTEYCSMQCLKAAKRYHQYECRLNKEFLEPSWMALRMVTSRTLKGVIDDERNSQNGKPLAVYRSDYYYNISRLYQFCDMECILEEMVLTIRLLQILQEQGYFATQGCHLKVGKLCKKEMFVAKLLYRYVMITRYNLFRSTRGGCYGGLFATLSLANHSCDPSVVGIVIKDRLVFRSIRPIFAGQQITINYIHPQNFVNSNKLQRMDALSFSKFLCHCQACAENWPAYSEGCDYFYLCNCKVLIPYNSGTTKVVCRRCKKNVIEELRQKFRLKEFKKLVDQTSLWYYNGYFERARYLAAKSITVGFKYFPMPNSMLVTLQDILLKSILEDPRNDSPKKF